jgi:hypothetical protein
MALHPKLQPYRDRKYIRKLGRVLSALEKDLASVQCTDFSVELLEEADSRSFMNKFLELRREHHCERVMYVRGRALEHSFDVLVPMHRHQLFPYTLKIDLNVSVRGVAAYEQGFAKKHWITEPKDEAIASGLKALKLPKIKWVFEDRGLKHKIKRGFAIGPRDDDSDLGSWAIYSGHFPASFFGGKLPKTSCFLEAVPRLEQFLSCHWH